MACLLNMPDRVIRECTAAALAPGLSDKQRLDELARLPGFKNEGAIASALLCAWDPLDYGVYDTNTLNAMKGRAACECKSELNNLPSYFSHLRRMRDELSTGGALWTARMVDMALFKIGHQ